MALNAAWHRAHRMPKPATLAQRVAWHEQHAVACGCRPMPEAIVGEIRRRDRARRTQVRPRAR